MAVTFVDCCLMKEYDVGVTKLEHFQQRLEPGNAEDFRIPSPRQQSTSPRFDSSVTEADDPMHETTSYPLSLPPSIVLPLRLRWSRKQVHLMSFFNAFFDTSIAVRPKLLASVCLFTTDVNNVFEMSISLSCWPGYPEQPSVACSSDIQIDYVAWGQIHKKNIGNEEIQFTLLYYNRVFPTCAFHSFVFCMHGANINMKLEKKYM